jgi:hypothetical protein
MKQISELREIVARATPGPWVVDRPFLSLGSLTVTGVMPESNYHPEEMYQVKTEHNHGTCSYSKHVAVPEHGHSCADKSDAAHNMEFIATFNPATVTELLDRVEKLEAANAVMRDALISTIQADERTWAQFPQYHGNYSRDGVEAKQALAKVEELMK